VAPRRGEGARGADRPSRRMSPPGSLALTRAPQKVIAGWAVRRRKKRTGGRG
jgi:hypothetical protein